MANTYLTFPFRQKDSVKALGGYWVIDAKRWCVLDWQDLAPLATWPSDSTAASAAREVAATSRWTALQDAQPGIPLFRLLQSATKAVADAYSASVWTIAEVLRASLREGKVYLELSERDADGRVVAKPFITV